jgi:tetratricopeptide (TPR) repeat protein
MSVQLTHIEEEHSQEAASKGDVAGALAALERATIEMSYDPPLASPFSRSHERYLRATLLSASGRDEEAIRWYSSFSGISLYDLIFLAPSHLRRGEIQERLGNCEKAIEHYERFIGLWEDCDPELRPLTGEAEHQLAQLRGKQSEQEHVALRGAAPGPGA